MDECNFCLVTEFTKNNILSLFVSMYHSLIVGLSGLSNEYFLKNLFFTFKIPFQK
jgi:hypothetical protein